MEKILFDDIYFMRKALEEAKIGLEKGEVPIGAIIVANETVIAKAHNMVEALNDPTAHAEMLALTSSFNKIGSKYLKQCTLYVTLEPCQMCAGATFWSQLGRIVYAASDKKRGFISKNTIIHPKTEISSGVLGDECANVLKKFFNTKRK